MWTLAVQNSDELINIWSLYFPLEPIEKCMTFKNIFFRTFQDQSDFAGLSWSWNFQEKMQNFPRGMKTLL